MKFYKKLEGDNIYLSPKSTETAEQFAEWMNDFATTDYIGRSAQIFTLQDEQIFLEAETPNDIILSIIRKEDDALIGTIGLHNINHINRKATLGIFIGDHSGRNKGYGTEAIRLILEFGFRYLNLKNIKLDLMEFNDRALACYKKCGFKEYGRRRKCNFINGKYYDTIEMDILSEEFEGDYIRNKNIK